VAYAGTLLGSVHGSSPLPLNIHTYNVCLSYPDVPLVEVESSKVGSTIDAKMGVKFVAEFSNDSYD
jgi:hypothetical protein